MLELYNFPVSTCSQKVRISLHEKGLEFVDHKMDSRNGDHVKPEYLKHNPNAVVPTLVHDGAVIIDSSVICEYLDEVFPEISMTPKDPVQRAKMRKWMRYYEEVPTPAVRFPSFQQVLIKGFQKLSPDEFDDAAKARPLRKHFYQRMGQTGFPQEDIDKAMDQLRQTCERMDAALRDTGGPWIMGEMYTLADICVLPSIDRMEDLGHAKTLWGDLPRVADWLARMQARPAVQKTYYPGTRMSEVYPELGLGKRSAA